MGYTMYVGVVPDVKAIEVPYWELDASSVAVVLLVCKGVLTLDEAVNCTRLPAEHLIHEAEAWAVASINEHS